MKKTDIKEISKKKLVTWLKTHDIASYRADQILKWIYLRQADSFEEMTDLSKNTRLILSEYYSINRLEKANTEISSDGTKKYLFRLNDGEFTECVLIPGKNRNTLCISSQVGCAQNCKFCLTAKGGFIRNLSFGEIISQVRDVMFDITGKDYDLTIPKPISNIVFMGMGEPLANLDNVLKAIEIITDADKGLRFSSRKVTVSTSGIVKQIPVLTEHSSVNLAVSLNATDNQTRSMLMPVNDVYPIETLINECKKIPLAARDKITFEYILIKGINDSKNDAIRLAKLLKPMQAKVNLIPFNEHDGCEFKSPDKDTISEFLSIIHSWGLTSMIRRSMGQDISAACGQLRANQESSHNTSGKKPNP